MNEGGSDAPCIRIVLQKRQPNPHVAPCGGTGRRPVLPTSTRRLCECFGATRARGCRKGRGKSELGEERADRETHRSAVCQSRRSTTTAERPGGSCAN